MELDLVLDTSGVMTQRQSEHGSETLHADLNKPIPSVSDGLGETSDMAKLIESY